MKWRTLGTILILVGATIAACAPRSQQSQTVINTADTILTQASFVADANDIVLDNVERLVKAGILPPAQAEIPVRVVQEIAKHAQPLTSAIEAAVRVTDAATQQAALTTAKDLLRKIQTALLGFTRGITSDENARQLEEAAQPLLDAVASTAAVLNRPVP